MIMNQFTNMTIYFILMGSVALGLYGLGALLTHLHNRRKQHEGTGQRGPG